jgi:hypothetical protein
MKERGACDAFRGGNLARILVSRPGRHNIHLPEIAKLTGNSWSLVRSGFSPLPG